ncbi:MAG: universal stress protein [Proteobacteria bacterium]|nr:universal stress protein [Pseudomonadota bacterium]
MEITKIVVGIDFSDESEVAAKYGVKIARHTGAEVVLVHAGMVLDHKPPESKGAILKEWEELVENQLNSDRDRLEALRTRLGSRSPEISHMVIDGFADIGLCDAAKKLGADLIITGTHGRTGVKRFFMGSVAERVVRLSPHNVLVTRPGAEEPGGFERILVPTDFSVQAEKAVQLAMVLAAKDGRIDVFHTWNTPPEIALEWTGPVLDELASEAQEAGTRLLARHHREGLTIAFDTVRAHAAEGIAERLESGNYDLVIMGSHGRRGLRRFLLGSIAERTVRHAPCSVLIVHQGDEDSD